MSGGVAMASVWRRRQWRGVNLVSNDVINGSVVLSANGVTNQMATNTKLAYCETMLYNINNGQPEISGRKPIGNAICGVKQWLSVSMQLMCSNDASQNERSVTDVLCEETTMVIVRDAKK